MPVIFAGFALLVWILAARYRRQPAGFLAVGLGLAVLFGVLALHTKLGEWTAGQIQLPVLRAMMVPYAVLVTGMGMYIACLPRRRRSGCPGCGYDLEGLVPVNGVRRCPECGVLADPKVVRYRRSGFDRGALARSDLPPPRQAVDHAAGEHKSRQAGDQAPAHR